MGRLNGEDIIKSLHAIKKVCEDNISSDKCRTCPFEVFGKCGITDTEPYNWAISEYKKFQALE